MASPGLCAEQTLTLWAASQPCVWDFGGRSHKLLLRSMPSVLSPLWSLVSLCSLKKHSPEQSDVVTWGTGWCSTCYSGRRWQRLSSCQLSGFSVAERRTPLPEVALCLVFLQLPSYLIAIWPPWIYIKSDLLSLGNCVCCLMAFIYLYLGLAFDTGSCYVLLTGLFLQIRVASKSQRAASAPQVLGLKACLMVFEGSMHVLPCFLYGYCVFRNQTYLWNNSSHLLWLDG